jgi:hypothetical protein
MLGLEMDIEADLGIDSIKRVEILSAMEERMPHLPQVTPDMVGTLKTLGQICDFLSGSAATPIVAADECSSPAALQHTPTHPGPYPVRSSILSIHPRKTGRPLRVDSGRWIAVLTENTAVGQSMVNQLEIKHIEARVIPIEASADVEATFSGAAGLIMWGRIDPESAFLAAKHAAPELFSASKRRRALCRGYAYGWRLRLHGKCL